MGSGDVSEVEVELPVRIDPVRTTLDLWRGSSPRAVLVIIAAVPLLAMGLSRWQVWSARPEAVLVEGPLLLLAVLILGTVVSWRAATAQAAMVGPEDRIGFTPDGVVLAAPGTTSTVPWSAVSALRMDDRATVVVTSRPRVLHRTEVPLPVEVRDHVREWQRAAPTQPLPQPPPPLASPAAEPPPPSGPPFTLGVVAGPPPPPGLHTGAAATAPILLRGSLNPPRSGRYRLAAQRSLAIGLPIVLLALAASTDAEGDLGLASLGDLLRGLAPLLPFLVIVVLMVALGGPRPTGFLDQQAARFLGDGPVLWTIDPGGVTQQDHTGTRRFLAWTRVRTAEVDGRVFRAAFDTRLFPARILIPVAAFTPDQLSRTLVWAQGRGRDDAPDPDRAYGR